jgi:hypothetical protein
MITDSVLKTVTLESKKQFYVFYDEWTGAIIQIASIEQDDSDNPYLLTDSYLAENILRGYENEKDYIVSFDDTNELTLVKKDNIVRLRSSETNLHQLAKVKKDDWDIRVLVYAANNKLVIEVNPLSIRKLSNMTFNKKIIIDDNNDLSLYIVKHNNPDYLIDTIDVDAQELLDNGNIIYDITSIRKHVSLADLGFLTRRCFKNYYLDVLNSPLNIVQHSLIKNFSYIHRHAVHGHEQGHINLTQKGNFLTFTTLLSSGELTDIGLHEDKLWVYLIGDTPDEYYGSIPINIREIKTKKKCTIKIQGSIQNYNLLHQKHKVTFSIKGTHA